MAKEMRVGIIKLKDSSHKFYVVYEELKIEEVYDPRGKFGTGLGPSGGINYFKKKGYTILDTEIVDTKEEYLELVSRLISDIKNTRRKHGR